MGIKEDFQNLDKVLKEFSFFKFICIDVANGYTSISLILSNQ